MGMFLCYSLVLVLVPLPVCHGRARAKTTGLTALTAEQGFVWRCTEVPVSTGVVPECVCAAKGEASPEPAAECIISPVSANRAGKCRSDCSAPALHAECRCLDKENCGRGFEVMQKTHLATFFFQVPARKSTLKQVFSFLILFFILALCVLLQDLLHRALCAVSTGLFNIWGW